MKTGGFKIWREDALWDGEWGGVIVPWSEPFVSTASGATGGYNVIKGNGKGEFIIGSNGDDKIFGRGGNDKINGMLGNDLLFGGAGSDRLLLTGGDKTYSGGKGRDTLKVSDDAIGVNIDLTKTGPQATGYGMATILGIENLKGADGNDTFVGNAKDNILEGGGGNDNIADRAGGDDHIYGDDGEDWLAGGPGDDQLHGGPGKDHLFGNAGKDNLYGGGENDNLDGGGGADVLVGGSGDDWLIGGAGADDLFGGGDNDFLDGGPGNDIEYGEGGNDTHFLSPGNDKHFGGPGSDWIVNGGAAPSRIDLSNPNRQDTGFGKDIIRGIENVFGGMGADHIKGNGGNNELDGFLGDDVIKGGGGADIINGGRGQDQLWGQGGYDVFVFASADDTPTATPDRIRDFTAFDDGIDLTRIDADVDTGGNQGFVWGGDTPTANGVWYVPATGMVFGDIDGDAVADFAIAVDSNVPLEQSDFLL